MTSDDIKNMDIEKIAQAIEKDAGQPLEDIRESLSDLKKGNIGKVHTAEQLHVVSARNSTGLSQDKFAELIETPVGTLRDWEQGRSVPPGAVIMLMKLIKADPTILDKVV